MGLEAVMAEVRVVRKKELTPEEQQDEQVWEDQFASTPDEKLDTLIAQVRDEIQCGKTRPLVFKRR